MATALLTQQTSSSQLHLQAPSICVSSFPLLHLPLEILLHNFAPWLDTQTLSYLTRTCKIFHNLLTIPLLRRAGTHRLDFHIKSPDLWLTDATVLQYAVVHHCQQPLLVYLLGSFPDLINQRSDIGLTPLQLCVMVNPRDVKTQLAKKETVRKLLVAGADTRDTWGPGYRPIHWAAQDGQLEVVKLLLGFGADACVEDGFGATPMEWALRNKKKRESQKVVAVLRKWQSV